MLPVLAPAETHPVVGVDVPRDIRVACEVKDDVWGVVVGKARYVVIVHDAYTRLIDQQQRVYGYIRF